MKIRTPRAIAALLAAALLLSPVTIDADESKDPELTVRDALNGMSFSGQWFLAYAAERHRENWSSNEFRLKRGYVTVKKKFSDNLSARVTQDIAVDHEGDGEGDIEIRLKYLYLRYRFGNLGFLRDMFFEAGLVHRPWLDFEQKVNPYRVQGTMYLERYKILRSADYGVTLAALLGPKLTKEQRLKAGDAYPGRYGSVALGIYNGGGYEAIEKNHNKLLESRVTLRPLPDHVPGLQLSWVAGLGKGNTEQAPDLVYNAAFVSWEDPVALLTAIFYVGTGDINGERVDSSGTAIDRDGFSVFGELKYPFKRFSVFGRFDELNDDLTPTTWYQHRYIAGISYRFYGKSRLLLDYDRLEQRTNSPVDKEIDETFEVAIQLVY